MIGPGEEGRDRKARPLETWPCEIACCAEKNETLQVEKAVGRSEAMENFKSQQEEFQRRWNELEITLNTGHLACCYFFSILDKGQIPTFVFFSSSCHYNLHVTFFF